MEDVALSRTLRTRSRPVCLRAAAVTSSRRWERNGVARTVVLMWRLRLEYALGADPEKLARLYRGGLRPPPDRGSRRLSRDRQADIEESRPGVPQPRDRSAP